MRAIDLIDFSFRHHLTGSIVFNGWLILFMCRYALLCQFLHFTTILITSTWLCAHPRSRAAANKQRLAQNVRILYAIQFMLLVSIKCTSDSTDRAEEELLSAFWVTRTFLGQSKIVKSTLSSLANRYTISNHFWYEMLCALGPMARSSIILLPLISLLLGGCVKWCECFACLSPTWAFFAHPVRIYNPSVWGHSAHFFHHKKQFTYVAAVFAYIYGISCDPIRMQQQTVDAEKMASNGNRSKKEREATGRQCATIILVAN